MIRNVLKLNSSPIEIISRDFKRNIKTASVPYNRLNLFQDKNPELNHHNQRNLTTINTKTVPQSFSMVSKDESREFMSVFPDIVRDITDTTRHIDIPEITKHLAKVLQYNIPNGKKNRGLGVVAAYKLLESHEKLTPENIRLANILGWCVEMLQGFLLMLDDVVDASETRRGVPCWYTIEGVGLQAVVDGISVDHGIYTILKKYFSGHPAYVQMMELFHEVTLKTSLGQTLDTMCVVNGKPQLDQFTMNRYKSITEYKTAYYTFQLPIALAMYLAGKVDPEIHRQVKTITLEMGHFFQIQDDYLDCFGNPDVTGKVGTDIREGKCTWLAVVALQRVTPPQRRILEEHYGKHAEESQEAVKKLYTELGLPNTYAVYEEESFNLIHTHIQQISQGLPHNLFLKFMEGLYRREC